MKLTNPRCEELLCRTHRVLIAGGRKFNDQDVMLSAINDLLGDVPDEQVVFISGMAAGADMLAYHIAVGNDIPVIECPAKWDDMSEPCVVRHGRHGKYNALAGMNRNSQMLDICTHVLAFWDGKSTGTKDTINKASRANLPIQIIRY